LSVKVIICDVPDYQDLSGPVTRSLAELGSDLSGRAVLVKPNILGRYPPEKGVNTHPALVREVVRQLLEAGARVWVGDNSGVGGYGANEGSAEVSGIKEASLGCYRNLARHGKEISFSSRFLTRVVVSREILEADLIVSLPKFKTHSLTVLTGAVKNTFGYLVGGEKSRLHCAASTSEDFGEAVVDVFQIRPPDLSIMDGVVAMEGYGPNNAPLRRVGKIIASRDAVALDRVMAEMTGISPDRVPFLRVAGERGVGALDLGRIEIEGNLERIPGFRLPLNPVVSPIGRIVNRFVYPFLIPRPAVDRGKCTTCGECARACPVGAIAVDEKVRIDTGRCILCYCCNELCPEQAIQIRGRVRRILGFASRALRSRS